MKRLEGFFDKRWGEDWQKPDAKFWKGFDKRTARTKI
jgi:hypothetical protein